MSAITQTQPGVETLRRPLFLWSLPFTYLYFALPIISKAFGASALEVGGLFTVFTLATLLMRPLVGWAVDRFGRKQFLVSALLIYTLAMLVFAFADSLGWLYAARFIQGVGSAFLWTAVNTIVADLTASAERGKAQGRLIEITTRGGLVGVLVAIILMTIFPQDVGWKIVMSGFAVLTLVSAVLARKSVPVTQPTTSVNTEVKPVSRQLMKLLAVVLITGVPEAMLAPIDLVYLQDKVSAAPMPLGWAFFPGALVAAFFSARLGALSDRFGRAPMMALGLAGSGLLYLLMPGLPSLVALAVVYVLSCIMWGISEPAETALVSELIGEDRRGMAYGLYDFVESLGFAIGPLLGGWLYDAVGSGSPFIINGVVLILGAGLVLVLLRGVLGPEPEATLQA
jgi:MFS family permease